MRGDILDPGTKDLRSGRISHLTTSSRVRGIFQSGICKAGIGLILEILSNGWEINNDRDIILVQNGRVSDSGEFE